MSVKQLENNDDLQTSANRPSAASTIGVLIAAMSPEVCHFPIIHGAATAKS